MRLACILLILGVLQTATFTTVSCNRPSGVTSRQHVEEDEVPRVKIKVFRGPTEEVNGELVATWGYWIKQPSR